MSRYAIEPYDKDDYNITVGTQRVAGVEIPGFATKESIDGIFVTVLKNDPKLDDFEAVVLERDGVKTVAEAKAALADFAALPIEVEENLQEELEALAAFRASGASSGSRNDSYDKYNRVVKDFRDGSRGR